MRYAVPADEPAGFYAYIDGRKTSVENAASGEKAGEVNEYLKAIGVLP